MSHMYTLCPLWCVALALAAPSPVAGASAAENSVAATESSADTAAADSQPSDSAAPLSVAPLDHIEYPDTRPEWVEPTLEFDKDTHKIVVVSGPSDTPEDSQQELDVLMRAAVSAYLSRQLRLDGIDIDDVYTDQQLDSELVSLRYAGEVMQGDMVRYENAVMLHFDRSQRERIADAWQRREVRERLAALSVLTLGGLAMLIGSSAFLGLVVRRSEARRAAA